MSEITGGRRELVWRNGVNDTDLGAMVWNDRARKSVMETYRKRGNPILLDINHNYNEDLRAGWEARGEPAPTAGNAYLEVDGAGNLWIRPEWSAYARAKIEGKELRFLSPDFAYDKKTNEITEIYRISLVAEPGTWNARMVANAHRRKGRLSMGISPELLAAVMTMATMMEAEQVSDGLKEAVNKVVSLATGGDDMAVEDPVDIAAAQPSGMPPKDDPILAKNTTLARSYSAQTVTLAARRLCVEKIVSARAELTLNPAEEKELDKIKSPEQMDHAIALLRAARSKKDDGKATLGREPAITDRGRKEPPKPTGNAYLDALQRHGMEVSQ